MFNDLTLLGFVALTLVARTHRHTYTHAHTHTHIHKDNLKVFLEMP